jgi:hypothetical protein
MNQKLPSYLSYLIRLRRVDNGGQPLWRISLEAPGAGERENFAELDDLVAFLRRRMTPSAAPVTEEKHDAAAN